ncbi:MAG TPA: hypothetical protein VMY42_00265 [Thermoguttaceae bacterium]|nr:hypothetical protein [Thermoguttaceae bacterium]
MKRRILAVILLMGTPLLAACAPQTPPDPVAADNPPEADGRNAQPAESDPLAPLRRFAGLFETGENGELEVVKISECNLTDADLAPIEEMTSLKSLNLFRTRVTDAGLVRLKGLTNLQCLVLSETEITDAGLAHLADLTSLDALDLSNTRITDQGLDHLAGLKNLTWLNLVGTRVTDAGVARLRQQLPGLEIGL